MADAIVLTGPTAAGKTELGIRVARRLDGEIISADSRQVFRGMDIGTAKATPEQRAAAPHHGLDLVDPDTRFSAGRFARHARRWIGEIRERGRVPILVGGTGFFISALTRPLFQEPELEPERRRRLDALLDDLDDASLRAWLDALDPEAARRLAAGGGRQRVTRALEIALLTGRTLRWWQRERPGTDPPLDAMTFVLHLPRGVLDERIDARVGMMIRDGLVDEVRRLVDAGYGPGDPGVSATGYPEVMAHLAGEIGIEEAVERTRRATRRYARRQLTWFRNQLPADAVWLDGTEPMDTLTERMAERWRRGR